MATLLQVPLDLEVESVRTEISLWHPGAISGSVSASLLYLYSANSNDEAITSYDKALKIKPDYSDAWFGRGLALKKLGRHVEELDSYVKAIEFDSDCPWYWYNRGNALGDLRRYWEAIASYNQALRLKPDYYDAIEARHEAESKLNG